MKARTFMKSRTGTNSLLQFLMNLFDTQKICQKYQLLKQAQ